MKVITFKLKGNAKPRNWDLPMNEVLIDKVVEGKSEGLKRVKYVPGVNSFFVEDQKGDLKPQKIWFVKGELLVPESNKTLLALLYAHPWYNKRYYKFDPEAEARQKLADLRIASEADRLIDEASTDPERIKAIALGVFGYSHFSKDPSTCELELREFARKDPEKLQKALNSDAYESKYIAALAFHRGIVKEDKFRTAVIWNDTTQGVIVKLAQGELGVDKLGRILSESSEKSNLLINAIEERLDRGATGTRDEDIMDEAAEKLKAKDAEIEALKKKMAEMEQAKASDSTNESKGEDDLEQVRAQYTELYKKDPAPAYKNNLEWLKEKVEAKL